MESIDALLAHGPYALAAAEKGPHFLRAMKSAFLHHKSTSQFFKQQIAHFDIDKCDRIEDFPFIPVDEFKLELHASVPEDEIVRIVESSGTSGNPSQVALDEVTIARQQRALSAIFADYIGGERKHFIVFDNKQAVSSSGIRTSSRASGLRGMTLFAKSMHFVLDKELQLDQKSLSRAIQKIPDGAEICIWGFTWMLHMIAQQVGDETHLPAGILEQLRAKLSAASRINVLHVGGWKKLEEQKVSKSQFNETIANALGIGADAVMDVYGMTEHLGTVYLDDDYGFKSVSTYSDVIIRDVDTLSPLGVGEVGRIQLLTPVPHSYPGVSILTTDLGRLEGIDTCPTGRPGKYFTFQGRYTEASQ